MSIFSLISLFGMFLIGFGVFIHLVGKLYKNEKLEEAVQTVVDNMTEGQNVSVTTKEVEVKKKPTKKPKSATKMKATKGSAKAKKITKKNMINYIIAKKKIKIGRKNMIKIIMIK